MFAEPTMKLTVCYSFLTLVEHRISFKLLPPRKERTEKFIFSMSLYRGLFMLMEVSTEHFQARFGVLQISPAGRKWDRYGHPQPKAAPQII
jgi:hypothetical protein